MAKQPERYVLKQGYFPEQPPKEPPVVLDPEYTRRHRKNTKPLLLKIAAAVLALGVIAAGIVFVPRLISSPSVSWVAADMIGDYREPKDAMKATVTANGIEIYWTSEDATALYWRGSFPVAPGTEAQKTVISTASADNAYSIMASGDPQKTFTVTRDTISCDVSALGITTKVTFRRVK